MKKNSLWVNVCVVTCSLFFTPIAFAKLGLYVKGGLGFNASSLIDKDDQKADNALSFFFNAFLNQQIDEIKKHTPGVFTDSINQFIDEYNSETGNSDNPNSKYTTAVVWHGAVGYNFWHLLSIPVRTDVSYTRRFDKKFFGETTVKADSQTIMLNGYLDLVNPTLLTPYAVASIGYANYDWGNSYKFVSKSKQKLTSAYSFGGGLIIDFFAGLALDLEYRYTDSGNYDVTAIDDNGRKSTFEGKMSHHDVSLSVSFTF